MKKEHALIKTLTKIPKSVFFFCFLINLSISSVLAADTYAQSTILTLQMNNKPIKEVFNYIEKNSEFVFVYLDNVIDSRKVVDVNLHNQPITVILDELFKGTDLTYKIDNRQILVKRKEAKESSFLSVQQTIDITGVVKDDVGEPVIGANILVKGTNNGVITDMEGRFSLKIPQANALLVVSYIGYISQEIQVGDKRSLTIILHPATEDLGEVVVTALGIKRETKALGYSVQEVKGGSLTEARESNVLNSLSGKLAGVQISRSGNGEGGSSRIIIRGNNSIAGNNEPLVVVDGVPVNNFNSGTSGIDQWGGSDGGNGLSDINPDDIESISVLKGAAAAALYGARAGNGVLMITTKKGSKVKGLGITWNSNVMMENPLVKPKMQNLYGQGTNGTFDANSNYSWGAKMEGQMLKDWTGQERPYSAYDNDITDFLGTGVTTTNTLEANAVNEKISFRGTLSYQRMDGVIPTNYQDKYMMNLRTTVNLSKKLSLDAKINYVKQRGWNRPQLTGSPENIMANYLMMPRNVHYLDMAGGVNEDGVVKRWTTDEANYVLNPYYTTGFNKNNNQRDRFIGFLALQYTPTSWLTIKLRHGEDMYWEKGDWRHASGTPYGKYNGKGDYGLNTSDFRERNTDALITATKDNWWDSGFSGSLSVGGNLMFQQNNSYAMSTGLLAIPDFFAISNGETPTPSHYISKKSVNSLYGFAQLSYKNWIFLDVTARNDWSSTLPYKNRSFFYPSVGLGWVVSDMLRSYEVNVPEWLSLAKLRASYAEVGNDTDPYRLLTTYGIYTVIDDIKGASTASTIPLADLKPELIKSTEAGFDIRFFNNRLGLDLTWYKKNATNQILALPISSTTGKSSRMINAGNIQNTGIEIVLNGTPVRTKDFEWNVSVNYSKNTNKIKELHPDSRRFILASTDFVNIVATEGSTYGDLYGRAYQRDEQGRKIIDENGLPLLESDMNTQIGNYMPKWTGSMINSFTYKNLSFSFMLDMRYGGDIFVNSLARGSQYGTTELSLQGRDEWYAGTGGIVVDGVTADGKQNTVAANPQAYWDRVSRAGEEFVYDGTNLRLRELTVGYMFPNKILAKTPFTNLKLSFVGRNLWLIKNNIPGYDPESSYSTGNGQGIEYASLPSMRSFGFNLNVSF
ncbi:SusC/RagA family TonB-linked outer membrane protein [Parabacteroides faecis]|uniref:SusC/RagA family TonB-linked outer membrane protein n=1 Tax=Parabacteroides TaxID=375288 RepID=UPI000EFF035A|nr:MULTISPECIES: SusC/RagA family TonB-linked outer membrane protein [Parabacteroides]MBC8617011.1 SusC/RagA family TonB-linked outer membrane protein [Parabacteroides faecis]RHR98008.1 SusC/RagA family TonB-linked outer membrane protein [Parabacteroides sp. AF14-59]